MTLQTVVVDLRPGASQDDLMAALERAACVEQVVFMGPDNLVQVDYEDEPARRPEKVSKAIAALEWRHPQSDGYSASPVRVDESEGIWTLTVAHPSGGESVWQMLASGSVRRDGIEDTFLERAIEQDAPPLHR